MVNKSKIAGTSWETAVVRYLRENIYPAAERRVLHGGADLGDIINAGPYVWECKNESRIDLAGGINELLVEIENAGVNFGFLITKRRNKSVESAYATMPLGQLVQLLRLIPHG